jgi:hypothetical protein
MDGLKSVPIKDNPPRSRTSRPFIKDKSARYRKRYKLHDHCISNNIQRRGRRMSSTAVQFSTFLLALSVGPATGYIFITGLILTGVAMLVAVSWVSIKDRLARTRSSGWDIVSAAIDIVSVARCKPGGNPILYLKPTSYNSYYKATLTYTYHYPDEQMGDYSRDFGSQESAEAWANSYKGGTVNVRVDPSDPTRSVLRKEDL